MPTELLKPNTNLRIRFTPDRRRRFDYYVEADRPVTTFILDRDELDRFDKGADFVNSVGGYNRRRRHEGRVRLPSDDEWYFLIVNEENEPVAVHYDLP